MHTFCHLFHKHPFGIYHVFYQDLSKDLMVLKELKFWFFEESPVLYPGPTPNKCLSGGWNWVPVAN